MESVAADSPPQRPRRSIVDLTTQELLGIAADEERLARADVVIAEVDVFSLRAQERDRAYPDHGIPAQRLAIDVLDIIDELIKLNLIEAGPADSAPDVHTQRVVEPENRAIGHGRRGRRASEQRETDDPGRWLSCHSAIPF